MFEKIDIYSRYIPLFLLKYGYIKRIKKMFAKNLYGASAMISNIGYLDAEKYSAPDFKTNTIFGILEQVYYPASLGITCCNNNLEIILSVPDVLRTNKRDELLLEKITQGIANIIKKEVT
jgi:hypothetical protein